VKKVQVIEVYSRDNEVYLVLPEHRNDKYPRCDDLSCSEVKKIMKEEAAKPLFLLRTE
jgi:hypothetical protein